eukprot:scaffold624_cov402-Prasinococcus_capsulatus_cf.AAC.34
MHWMATPGVLPGKCPDRTRADLASSILPWPLRVPPMRCHCPQHQGRVTLRLPEGSRPMPRLPVNLKSTTDNLERITCTLRKTPRNCTKQQLRDGIHVACLTVLPMDLNVKPL